MICVKCNKEIGNLTLIIRRLEEDENYHKDCYDKILNPKIVWYEKLTDWIVHLFPKTLKDITDDSRLQGFAEGYQLSGKQGQELKQIHYKLDRFEQQQAQLILQVIKDEFPNA